MPSIESWIVKVILVGRWVAASAFAKCQYSNKENSKGHACASRQKCRLTIAKTCYIIRRLSQAGRFAACHAAWTGHTQWGSRLCRAAIRIPERNLDKAIMENLSGSADRNRKLNIVISLLYYFPHRTGLTLHVQSMAEEMVRRGHDVTVITARYSNDLPRDESTHNGVRIVRLWAPIKISRGMIMPAFPWAAYFAMRSADIVSIHTPMLETALVTLLNMKLVINLIVLLMLLYMRLKWLQEMKPL